MYEHLPTSQVSLHGHEVHYVRAGSGPTLVLLHGLLGSHRSWSRLVDRLSHEFTVVAPDLLGHGESAKPLGDYSLGAFAASVRDLLDHVGVGSATIVGHSLGGGIAMEFGYLFPERCERMVLVSSGGLGPELNLLLRAPTLPGAEFVLPVIGSRRLHPAGEAVGKVLHRLGVRWSRDVLEAWRGYTTLADAEARRAFLATIRTVAGWHGQLFGADDKLYLLEGTPTLIVWGGHDRLIPAKHALDTQARLPHCRVEVFENAGHFPHLSEPQRFEQVLTEFVAQTQPRHHAAG